MRVIWSPRALTRVVEIGQHIAADRPAAARTWVIALFERAATLREHPRRGRRVPEVDRNEIREVIHGDNRLIYRVEPKRLVVLTVRHGRWQWDPTEVIGKRT
jgi:plasmid stabilization system protein ParE